MKQIVTFLVFLSCLTTEAASLNCAFGFSGVAILTSQTELNADGSIGEYTKAAYQGTPAKEIPNVVLPVSAPVIYYFQLDEGFGSNNLNITVSSKRNEQDELLAVVENPQTPQFKKMNGSCKIE